MASPLAEMAVSSERPGGGGVCYVPRPPYSPVPCTTSPLSLFDGFAGATEGETIGCLGLLITNYNFINI